jgi:hypothetical protein
MNIVFAGQKEWTVCRFLYPTGSVKQGTLESSAVPDSKTETLKHAGVQKAVPPFPTTAPKTLKQPAALRSPLALLHEDKELHRGYLPYR